jgi:hypothetical protein
MTLTEQREHYRAIKNRLGNERSRPVVRLNPVISQKKEELPPPPPPVIEVIQETDQNPFLEVDDAVKAALKWPPRDAVLEMLDGTGVTLEQLKSRSREQKLVDLRHHAFWILRTRFNWSMPKIGRFFNRDHTTALHGVERWQKIVDAQGEQNARND